MPSNNRVIIAAAGARKTERVVDYALADPAKRTLIVTYTNENQREIIARIERKNGTTPANVQVMGWFTFVINECARPFQRSVFGQPHYLRRLNFIGRKPDYVGKNNPAYFFDSHRDIYRDGVSDFAVLANINSNGSVIRRLERAYDHILIDEVQDLTGFDLDILDLLLRSRVAITTVGDPRQFMIRTTNATRNRRYSGTGIVDWFKERDDICQLEEQCYSYRCSKEICEFADALFPGMPTTESRNTEYNDHVGISIISVSQVAEYVEEYGPTILTYNKNSDTRGYPGINIGLSKGKTYDRVLIAPSGTMLNYVKDRNLAKFKEPEKLYVAVTRARFSATFIDYSQ
ncbi:helicase [Mycobacterium marinum M]|uniref:Helicase n=1 Tax=Mycobacterium marinum (strain ATCC BAA-535 / M) TaxID=216594 RepID=B2HL36_MYCMM|nr:UvrD-helicase domain-containing protein [Mycobacterium marinum]ACC42012.1 helicase [Mycobacterium marinum M]